MVEHIPSLGGRIRIDGPTGELAENIGDVINRRGQQADGGLEGGLVGRTRVRARGHEHLGPTEGLAHRLALLGRQRVLQPRQVGFFLLLDVLREVFHERLDGGDEVGMSGLEVLEVLQFLFHLCRYARQCGDPSDAG